MDMEIQLLYESLSKKDFKLFLEHVQRMGSGEAPLFATTLSLVYDKLVEKAFARPIPSGSGVGKPAEVQSVADPRTPFQAPTSIFSFSSTSAFGVGSSSTPQAPAPSPFGFSSTSTFDVATPSTPQAPASNLFGSSTSTFGVATFSTPRTPIPNPRLVPSSTSPPLTWLRCNKCRGTAKLKDLYERVRCPVCPSRSVKKGRPYMNCSLCGNPRTSPTNSCTIKTCRVKFM